MFCCLGPPFQRRRKRNSVLDEEKHHVPYDAVFGSSTYMYTSCFLPQHSVFLVREPGRYPAVRPATWNQPLSPLECEKFSRSAFNVAFRTHLEFSMSGAVDQKGEMSVYADAHLVLTGECF